MNEDLEWQLDAIQQALKHAGINADVKPTHIDWVKVGDTIWHAGHIRTLDRQWFKQDSEGTRIWGDSYKGGTLPVIILKIRRALPGGRYAYE